MRFQKNTFLLIPNKNAIRGMSPTHQTVYIRLCEYIGDDLSCYPSYETIAKSSWCSRRTVIRTIKDLCSIWLLVKESRFSDNEQTTNKYYIEIIDEPVTQWHPPVTQCHHLVTECHHPVTQCHPELNNLTQLSNSITSKEVQQSWPPPKKSKKQSTTTLVAIQEETPPEPPSTPPKGPNKEINELILEIKNKCDKLGLAYSNEKDTYFARHILKAQEFGAFAERIGKTRQELAIAVLTASVQINFRRGPCTGPYKIYKNYAEVYNERIAQNKKQKDKNIVWKLY